MVTVRYLFIYITVSFILGCVVAWIYKDSTCSTYTQQIMKRSIEMEEYYHEQVKKLPPCYYDPSVYNSMFR